MSVAAFLRPIRSSTSDTFAHEGLELEKKIFVTSSTRRKSGVMDAEAVVGRVSGCVHHPGRGSGRGIVGESDALARNEQSLTVSKRTEGRI